MISETTGRHLHRIELAREALVIVPCLELPCGCF